MLKHTVSGGLNGGPRHVSQDPRGFAPPPSSEVHRIYRSPPPPSQVYNGGPPHLNISTTSSQHHRSFNNGNPYSNTSSLSNSKHSGGTPVSVTPMANGGLHISRPPHPPPTNTSYYEQRPNYTQPTLNVSTLSTSKHSLGGNSSSVSPLGMMPRMANGGLNLSRGPAPSSVSTGNKTVDLPPLRREPGVREMLTSLGLLCLVSLLLALLSLVFMLKISPVTAADVKDFLRTDQLTVISPEEYVLVYEVTLALCALSLSLNLCCLLVCAVQFLFAVKLVRDSPDGERTNKYLRKSAFTRVCAVGGFFVSIPVFLTGIILYTFIQFHSTPALITSVLIGLGIIFCGCAMVHNVFVWQKEKTNAVRALASQQRLAHQLQHQQEQQEQSHQCSQEQQSWSSGDFPNSSGQHPRLLHSSLIQQTSGGGGSISPHISLDIANRTPTPPEICTLV